MKQVRALRLENDGSPSLKEDGTQITKVFDLAMWNNVQKFPNTKFKFLSWEEEKVSKVADIPVKVVEPKQQPAKVVTPTKKVVEQKKVELSIVELRKMYKTKFGKKPFAGWKEDKLKAKLEL